MIHHFDFVGLEQRAPAAFLSEDALTCAEAQWARGMATWWALFAFWQHWGYSLFRALFQKRSKLASLLKTQAEVSGLWGPGGVRAGLVQCRTKVLRRENDFHHPVVPRPQNDVAMPEIRVGWPLRGDAVASYARQTDHRRMGNPNRDSNCPTQTARPGPNAESLPGFDFADASAGLEFADFAAPLEVVAPALRALVSLVSLHVAIRIDGSTIPRMESHRAQDNIHGRAHHTHHIKGGHPHCRPDRKSYKVGIRSSHPPHIQ